MRNLSGVIDTTMSVRRSPFGEWVIIYYDPKKTNEKTLLEIVRKGGCPRADIIRKQAKSTEITPIITPGDTALIKLHLEKKSDLKATKLPTGWAVTESLKQLDAGTHYISIRTPEGASQKEHAITLQSADNTQFNYTIELVSRVSG